MGFDESKHYFLPAGSNIIKNIKFGGFTKAKLLELAPLSAWALGFPAKKSSFYIDSAIDCMIRESENKGFFKPDLVRGAGVWIDNENIIINDGNNVCDHEGKIIENIKSKYFYVKSDKDMGDFAGQTASNEQGNALVSLFMAQGFETELQAFISLGWSLIAPFGGILKWRPHIWITGPRGSGKTYILENLVRPLCGPFAYVGSGKDSEAGLYRTLWRDPCPVIKDEMEPGGNKETRMKIEQTLEVARNASSDFSAYKTIANMGGGVDRFCIRSCFCFSSIVPYLPGDAIESRIMISRLKNISFVKKKFETTKELLKTGIMNDPGIFRRKIYKCLPTIMKNIEILRPLIMQQTGDAREADNLAPIFSAIFALILGDEAVNPEKAEAFLLPLINKNIKNEDGTDEDKLLHEIFDYSLRIGTECISIAELVMMYDKSEEELVSADYKNALLRTGIKIHQTNDGVKCLAIARNHGAIKKILNDSIYAGRYVEVLKRHEGAVESCKSVRFASQVKNSVLINWEIVKEKYFSYEDIADQSGDLFEDIL